LKEEESKGRFPANVICSDDALNDGVMEKSNWRKNKGLVGGCFGSGKQTTGQGHNDSGSKSRYFDIDVWAEKHGLLQFPKASKRERNEGCEGLEDRLGGSLEGGNDKRNGDDKPQLKPTKNHHPCVKPVHLMAWLVRLVSKEGDIVLDPFMGSGTTGVACKKLNRNFIGIELDPEYCKISEVRIKSVTEGRLL